MSLLRAWQQTPCCPEAGPEDTATHKPRPRSPLVPRHPLGCRCIHLPEAGRPGGSEDGCHTPGTVQKPHPGPKHSAGQGLRAPSQDPGPRLRERSGPCLVRGWQAERAPRPPHACRAEPTASMHSGHCQRPARGSLAPASARAPSLTVYAEATCRPGDRSWSRPGREASVTLLSWGVGVPGQRRLLRSPADAEATAAPPGWGSSEKQAPQTLRALCGPASPRPPHACPAQGRNVAEHTDAPYLGKK